MIKSYGTSCLRVFCVAVAVVVVSLISQKKLLEQKQKSNELLEVERESELTQGIP